MHDDEAIQAHLPGQMLRTLQGAETLPLQQIAALLEEHQIDEALLQALGYLAQAAYRVHRADRSETPQTLRRLVHQHLSEGVQPDTDAPSAPRTGHKP